VLAQSRSRANTAIVESPETRYAKSGEVYVAYEVLGEGPHDVVYVPGGPHHVELTWENPPIARSLRRLATLSRLIVFDKRGTGMSDPIVGLPTLETRMDDIRAVMDAAKSRRAVLYAIADAGPLCALFAATYPERTAGLVLIHATPRFVRAPEFPWLPTRVEFEQRIDEVLRYLLDPAERDQGLPRWSEFSPEATEEELQSFARGFRLSVSPGTAVAYMRANLDVDVSEFLPLIRVPTLVLCRMGVGPTAIQSSRYLAARIPGARLVELPGASMAPSIGDQESLFAQIEHFLHEAGGDADRRHAEPERVLSTVLFTDIVDATSRASALGDRAWRELLATHHQLIRSHLSQFGGKEVDTAGDSFFATFDGPARAIRCACAIRDGVGEIGLQVRLGLHSGECEVIDDKITGIAVHIGARVASLAESGEILVSRTVKDLVAGSGIEFEDRGAQTLKGVPGEWRLYEVAAVGS
jgi:class 3 adenylate cyclase/pimeloyl-ACP methyl ester carboxylesterase